MLAGTSGGVAGRPAGAVGAGVNQPGLGGEALGHEPSRVVAKNVTVHIVNIPVRYRLSGGTAKEISASVEAGVRGGQLNPGDRLPAGPRAGRPARHQPDHGGGGLRRPAPPGHHRRRGPGRHPDPRRSPGQPPRLPGRPGGHPRPDHRRPRPGPAARPAAPAGQAGDAAVRRGPGLAAAAPAGRRAAGCRRHRHLQPHGHRRRAGRHRAGPVHLAHPVGPGDRRGPRPCGDLRPDRGHGIHRAAGPGG